MPSWPTSSLFYKIVVFVTMIYMLIELVIGYQYNSLVLISDSYHMFSDVFTWVIALYGDAISESEQVDHLGNVKESDSFSFGFGRSKMLANLINGVSLFALSLTLGLEAIQRFYTPEDVDAPLLVLIVGACGFLWNVFLAFVLEHYEDEEEEIEHNLEAAEKAAQRKADHDSHGNLYPWVHVAKTDHYLKSSRSYGATTSHSLAHPKALRERAVKDALAYPERLQRAFLGSAQQRITYHSLNKRQTEKQLFEQGHTSSRPHSPAPSATPKRRFSRSSHASHDHDHGHTHGHSHSHDNDSQSDPAGNLSDDSQLDYPDEPSQGGHNHHGGKFAAALLHVLSDMLINFSVILSGGLSYGFGPQSPSGTSMFFASGINANYRTPYVSYVDPLLSLIIVVMLIKPTLKLINSQTYGLLQAIHPADTRRLRNRLFRTLPQIAADEHGQPMITELHLWELQHDVKVGSVKIGVHVNNFNELEWLRKAAENAFIQFGVRKEFANIELYDPTWDPTKAHYLKLGERKVNHVEGPRPGTPPAHEHHSALGRVKKAAKKVTGKGRKKGSRSGDVPVSSGEDSS